MNTDSMTVAQITRLLNSDSIAPQLLQALKKDTRRMVVRLLQQWEQRRLKAAKERERVKKLYAYESSLKAQGCQFIAGVDEAGRGPLAGPVVIAAVILPYECHFPLLNDSKKLLPSQRETLYTLIMEKAVAVSYQIIENELIDQINIYQATIQGMYRAIAALSPTADSALIDAVPLSDLLVPSLSIVGGDAKSASIAAASIIAKVERDRIMDKLHTDFPMYGFCRNKGYGTPEHLEALRNYGPCPFHRRTFEPVKSWGKQS
ncbi:ribonuclease hii [Lucifera butyrica]|uniref:Ribonuclease HII n=1 Tax=Lucifera butyrica TaxID=1351585 RepID=A0A498R2E4_9FIRM|nr:ribonuclease HII [Lucifera butyrica]VBB05634.1 ribonuclease hii [Lucifera butyrica]